LLNYRGGQAPTRVGRKDCPSGLKTESKNIKDPERGGKGKAGLMWAIGESKGGKGGSDSPLAFATEI